MKTRHVGGFTVPVNFPESVKEFHTPEKARKKQLAMKELSKKASVQKNRGNCS